MAEFFAEGGPSIPLEDIEKIEAVFGGGPVRVVCVCMCVCVCVCVSGG